MENDDLTAAELDAIEARADAATHGPWRWWTSNSYRRLSSDATGRDGDVLRATVYRDGQPGIEGTEQDAEHIAGMDPPTTKRLITALRAARERERNLRQLADDQQAEIKRLRNQNPYKGENK